jgi:hypothetical protein
MKQLDKGKLYQVRHWRDGWIIAEYLGGTPAHEVTGRRSDGATKWHEPASHHWREIEGSSFGVYDKNMQTRPISIEAAAEVDRLRLAIANSREQTKQLVKQLREFCS